MTTKGPECWGSDANARALRVEVTTTRSILLPYDQFVYAEIKSGGAEQELRAIFASHEVVVRGSSLRRLVTALQRMELGFITPLSASARSGIPDGQPVIREITVSEVRNPDAAMPGQQAA